MAAAFLAPGTAAAEPAEGRPCVLCHPSRDPNAYADIAKMPGVTPGRESAEEFVCWSCHGGAVRDDRARLSAGGRHPVGIPGSASGDGRFPLYGGRVVCGTCHTAHNKGALGKRWLRAGDDLDGVCAGCHPGHDIEHRGAVVNAESAAWIRSLGGRVGDRGRMGCRTCHTPHGATGPKLLLFPPGTDFCTPCHTNRQVPGKIAADRTQPCADCHEAHGKDKPFLKGGGEGPCRACHETYGGPADHLTTGGEGCGDCHSIHRPALEEGKSGAFLLFPSAGGALCLRCHPEVQKRHGSATAVPVDAVPRLREKGLNVAPNGSLTCISCHQTHGSPYRGKLSWSASVACLYCHPNENPYGGEGLKPGIHPVGVFLTRDRRKALDGKALSGPEEAKRSYSIADPGVTLTCGSCHDTHGIRRDKPADCVSCHPERKKTAAHGGKPGCTACHQIHGATPPAAACTECHRDDHEYLHMGKAKPTLGGDLPLFDAAGASARAGDIGCPTCHDPHGKTPAMLRRDSPDKVCAVCHADKERIRSTPHGGGKLPAVGKRWKKDLCLPCHSVHRDETPDLAKKGELGDPLAERCLACHERPWNVIDDHTMRGVPPWKKTTGLVPLFNALGQRDAMGFMSCPTCHDAHGGKGGGLMRVSAADPPDLCLSCHRERAVLLGSSHDPKASGKKQRCTTCHPPHSEEDMPSAWRLQVTGSGTWNDRKCTGCHAEGSMEDSPYHGGRSHPVNVTLTRARPVGGLPLYDTLGRGGGAVLACATCHDVHGVEGTDGKRIGDFLRASAAGGSLCGKCHPEELSVAATPHDIAAPKGRLAAPCGPCHTAHGAFLDRGLWALQPGEGEYAPNRLCRTCHSDEEEEKRGKPLLMQYHMRDAEERLTPRGTIYLQRPMSLIDQYALRTGEKPAIALYDREGRVRPEGSLQCASCHEPHRWSPFGPQIKPGVPVHDTVPRHFTRFDDFQALRRSVCADCHDKNIEAHYRRYHEVWTDVGEEFHRDTQIEKARRAREEEGDGAP